MGRMSEEQKKDMKIKIFVGLVLAVVIGTGVAIGPGLEPIFLEKARKNKTAPWAPEWYYNCARIMQMTFREERAQEIYDEFYLNFGGYDWELDFETVLAERSGDESQAFYMPWLNKDYDGFPGIDEDDPDIVNRRPAPVSKTPHPLLGKVLYQKAYHFEREREYYQCDHLWSVLYNMWPEGSWEHTEAAQGRKRRLQSSF